MTTARRRVAALAILAGLVIVLVVLLTRAGGETGAPSTAGPGIGDGGSGYREPAPRGTAGVAPPPPGQSRAERRANTDLPVPLARAAARLFLVGFGGTEPPASLRRREWGAVLVDPANAATPARLGRVTRRTEAVARAARHEPPRVAARQRGGEDAALAGIGPPRQPSIRTPAAAERAAAAAGRALRRRGVTLARAPSADLRTAGGPWQDRGFSDDPEEAGELVAGAVTGWRQARVAPVVGHFPGEGGATQDPELGVASVGLGTQELRDRDLVPFAAVARTAPAVQLSGALFVGFDAVTPATLDPGVVRALRAQRFDGVVVSANLTAVTAATGGGVGDAAVAALVAGCDLLFVPGDRTDQEEAYRAVVAAVRAGEVPPARVREALERLERLRTADA